METTRTPDTLDTMLRRAGDRVRAERKTRRWTQGDLGDRAGVSLQTVWLLETHQLGDAKLSTLLKIADAFGFPLPELLA